MKKVLTWVRRPAVAALLGVVVGGAGTYVVVDELHGRAWSLANREYKATSASVTIRAAARLRAGRVDDAIRFLEDQADSFAVGVPMGEQYDQMSERCRRAMAVIKVYRDRFPYQKGDCTWHGDDLHKEHLPRMLEGVPVLASGHEWLDDGMRAIQVMPEAVGEGG